MAEMEARKSEIMRKIWDDVLKAWSSAVNIDAVFRCPNM